MMIIIIIEYRVYNRAAFPQDLREENLKHIQYAAAKDNLKHIFTVPEIVDKCRTYILEGGGLGAGNCDT